MTSPGNHAIRNQDCRSSVSGLPQLSEVRTSPRLTCMPPLHHRQQTETSAEQARLETRSAFRIRCRPSVSGGSQSASVFRGYQTGPGSGAFPYDQDHRELLESRIPVSCGACGHSPDWHLSQNPAGLRVSRRMQRVEGGKQKRIRRLTQGRRRTIHSLRGNCDRSQCSFSGFDRPLFPDGQLENAGTRNRQKSHTEESYCL